ncbi:protein NnrT [Tropicibacter sp. R16_0]|uniref:protein NnrT n=1 Tax=Tropicibacter sp. R16_0 TaxID=2821102 RepID=UPI001ADD41B6|nr:protein NnrT [Tropicibacter sp. R16_0]MBO9450732.1 protein NnrT [Tropicibacter sp. R16_0]
MRNLSILLLVLASPAWAGSFDRPIPQAQSATAEFWFAAGSIALLVALGAVHWLVSRR